MNTRFLATVASPVLAVSGVWGIARLFDESPSETCQCRPVARAALSAPGQVDHLGPAPPSEAADWAKRKTGLAVNPPCDALPAGFVLTSLSVETGGPRFDATGPSAEWTLLPSDPIAEPGITYFDRSIRIGYGGKEALGDLTDGPEVVLGIGERAARRVHHVSIEPPDSDHRSSENLQLYVLFDGGYAHLYADFPPGQLPPDAVLLRLLRSATRGLQ